MNTRPFGKTGFQASEMGLGCWQLGGSDWGSIDDAQAMDILGAAVDSGVNFLDTADVYGGGRSEELIGRFLKGRSGPIYVATKLGRAGGIYPDGYTEAALRSATQASIRRLGVEVLDLTQLHCIPTEILRRGEVFEWLRALKRDGLIRDFGVSVESMEEAAICLGQEGLASLQIIFNLFRQKPITTLFPEALARGIAIIVRLPLASGALSGKLTRQTHFAENDHRNYNRDGQKFNVGETFAGLPFEAAVDLAGALKPLVPEGQTLARMAQRWILDHEAVSVVITGASRPSQAVENARVSDLPPLRRPLHEQLEAFYKSRVERQIRGPY
jgi:aryl-alcohol dehydrogenase-like predicted oxidoreductase